MSFLCHSQCDLVSSPSLSNDGSKINTPFIFQCCLLKDMVSWVPEGKEETMGAIVHVLLWSSLECMHILPLAKTSLMAPTELQGRLVNVRKLHDKKSRWN